MDEKTKSEIRQQMREKRHAVDKQDRAAAGRVVREKIISSPVNLLTRAWRVCLYLSAKNEIPTRYIARAIWEAGREVCVPAWSNNEKTYKLYALDPRTKLITGHRGIKEPAVRIPVFPWEVDAFIMPGLAFDVFGGRLGYGKGYYDKILSKASKKALKIALCYDWQLLDTPLPQEDHDIKVDWVVTDQRAVKCSSPTATRRNSPS
ncbi:MAG: 5-formyltetrahydrofolate cyclo-ligase [Kiritimatiellae bacterium]|nr:5-formyltetrahydrofolate cyclo-ligase [Kiritimatiellia bacterium]